MNPNKTKAARSTVGLAKEFTIFFHFVAELGCGRIKKLGYIRSLIRRFSSLDPCSIVAMIASSIDLLRINCSYLKLHTAQQKNVTIHNSTIHSFGCGELYHTTSTRTKLLLGTSSSTQRKDDSNEASIGTSWKTFHHS